MTDTSQALTTIPNSDMAKFNDADIKRAGELLGVPLDAASALRALIIQRDTGLSLARGEISVVVFGGKPTVFINKQGYLTYANMQPDYEGYESGIIDADKGDDAIGWCKVYRVGRKFPIKIELRRGEFDKKSSTWLKMPLYMLEKTAISIAHRTAFPVLNGTYSEEEYWGDKPVVIEQRIDDITIVPEVVNAEPEKPAVETCGIEYAQKVLENMDSRGFDTSVFEQAKIDDKTFNKTMIDEDFARQVAKEKPKREKKPAPEVCPQCKQNPPMTPEDIEKLEGDCDLTGVKNIQHTLCKECAQAEYEKRLGNVERKSEFKPREGYIPPLKCEECGKGFRDENIETTLRVNKIDKMLCPDCVTKVLVGRSKAAAEKAKVEAEQAEKSKEVETPSEDLPLCHECGKPVPVDEQKITKLFAPSGKALCKACLNKPAERKGGAA